MADKRGYKLQEFLAHDADVTCLNIGKKSCRIFVTGSDDRKVKLWEFGKPICLLSFTGHTSSVQSVTFDSAEVLVLAGSSNGVLKLWDLEEAKLVRTIPGHRSNCTAVQFHPFGEFLASGSLDADLKIWDIRKKGCTHTYKGHSRGIRTIKFSPDGRWVVTGGDDHIVKVWDLTAGKLLHDFKFHNGIIRCIDFHPQEFLLATGSTDRTVNFWDLETFELIGSAGPEASGVRSMVFHPDGRNLFCGLDETLKVFSWEPIRCHDFVDMGWSNLGDVSICEGKLLGCSYNQSQVGTWVTDISLISPYAAGVVPKKDGSMLLKSAYIEDHPVELKHNFTDFSRPLVAEPDCQDKTKDALRCSPVKCTANTCNQTAPIEGLVCSPVTLDSKSSGLKNNSSPMSCENHLHGSKSSLPTSNSTNFRVSKTPEVVGRNANVPAPGFPTSRIHRQLTRKKESLVEVEMWKNTRATDKHVVSPVIVPRDSGSGQHYVDGTTTRNPQVTSKTELHHVRQSSFSGGGNNIKKKLSVSRPSSSPADSDPKSIDFRISSRLTLNAETIKADESNVAESGSTGNMSARNISLHHPVGLDTDEAARPTSSSRETNRVKYVRGVAVELGRTRSLVERFEKKETSTASGTNTVSPSHEESLKFKSSPLSTNGEEHIISKETKAEEVSCEILVQGHDVFINQVKSRLTKLQVVHHFWAHNGIKGAIDAVVKLPDHSVQADVVSILMEKTGLLTLDMFSLLLPLLLSLLNSKTERHAIVSLELLFELIKTFGPVIHSTVSNSPPLGVDLQAERRLELCKKSYNQLLKIRQILPMLIRNGGSLAKHAQKLNVALIEL